MRNPGYCWGSSSRYGGRRLSTRHLLLNPLLVCLQENEDQRQQVLRMIHQEYPAAIHNNVSAFLEKLEVLELVGLTRHGCRTTSMVFSPPYSIRIRH